MIQNAAKRRLEQIKVASEHDKKGAAPQSKARIALRRIAKMSLLIVFGFLVAFATLVGCFQRKMIYFPGGYGPSFVNGLPENTEQLQFKTAQGLQTAFYIPPRENPESLPDRLWVLFGGNAARAMDWLDMVESSPNPKSAFLLIDYPGYGLCEGAPSRANIKQASAKAYERLLEHLALRPQDLKIAVLGHSLGAAAALEFAAVETPEKIILLSPFTSLMDMARAHVKWPLCLMLLDRFDNRKRLDDLSRLPNRPRVLIIHGSADEIIPAKMGRELSKMHPDWIEFHEILHGDHNFIIDLAEDLIFAEMAPEEK